MMKRIRTADITGIRWTAPAYREGYPGDMVPLVGVDSAVILGSAKQQMGAEGTSYVIIFGLDEPV